MSTFISLLKREFWEHKRIIMWPPAVMAFIAIGLAISFLIYIGSDATLRADDNFLAPKLTVDQRAGFATAAVFVSSGVFLGICGLTALYYLAGALYNDRKDRSILFWKSLPTTELQTIFSKLITGMLAFPAFAMLFAAVTVIACYCILSIFALFLDDHVISIAFSETGVSLSEIINGIGVLGTMTFHTTILSIPLFCYLLFISSISRRSPIFFAILPYIVIQITFPIWGALIGRDHWLITFFVDYYSLTPDLFADLEEHLDTQLGSTAYGHTKTTGLVNTLSAIEFWIMMVISGGLLWATTILRKRSGDLA